MPQKELALSSLKERVSGNRLVTFVRYREAELWYRTEDGFEFPVPTQDLGTATLLASDKALLFMRYIRRHMKMIDEARVLA
jgi:hypothetical protein